MKKIFGLIFILVCCYSFTYSGSIEFSNTTITGISAINDIGFSPLSISGLQVWLDKPDLLQ